ncbi:MAG TPA: alpha/beta fold hydrolase [Vicinamibacterales bacterium]|nr:alpha/beta fold hydrolase [Vicinamibacterales bacterium]
MTRWSRPTTFACLLSLLAGVGLARRAEAQQASPPRGTLERVTVHGRALEGNLEGDSPDRAVIVYLPPSYATATRRRYPVVYFLHGYASTAEAYVKSLQIPDSIDRAIAAGAGEMIVVLPDASSKFGGSMFSNSPTVGDWETFIARDLPSFIDGKYRTIATREGRGLAGHSMGGYGTMRIGMKRPDVFGAMYAMSSCCLFNNPAAAPAPGQPQVGRGALVNALSAQAAAWAPNVTNPPGYFDLPTKDGAVQPVIAAQWVANSPLVMVGQYGPALRSMKAIALDVGDQDPFASTNRQLDEALTRVGATHSLEVYEGNHGNRIRERFETKVIPFFSRQLTHASQ